MQDAPRPPRRVRCTKLLDACCVLGLIGMLACSSTHSLQSKPRVHGIIVHPIDLDPVVLAEGVIGPRTALPTSISKGSCLYVFAQGTWIVTAGTESPAALHLQQRTPAGIIASSFDIMISNGDMLQGASADAGILRHEVSNAASYARCIHDGVLAHLVAHGLRLLVGIDEKRIVAVMLEAASTPELVSLADPAGRPGGELYWAFVERVEPWSISKTGMKEIFGNVLSTVAGMMREDEVRQTLSTIALQLDSGEVSVRVLILTAHDRAPDPQRAQLVAAIAPLIARVEELRGSRAFEALRELVAAASRAGNQDRPVGQS